MRVMKFGGTSVANAERLRQVSDIVVSRYKKHNTACAVVSAFSGVTDLLLNMVELASHDDKAWETSFQKFVAKVHEVGSELLPTSNYEEVKPTLSKNNDRLNKLLVGVSLIQEASPKTKDLIVSFGERTSAYILANYLASQGYPAHYLDARQCIKTDSVFGSASVDFKVTYPLIKEHVKEGNIYIITGFIGSDQETGVTTTLGRGGSDYSGAIFAAALDASELEIWTDVSGVLTSDPRKVKHAYPIAELSYEEAAEMSHFGAKVLYGPTIRPVKEKNIPTRILNTFSPQDEGTLIHHEPTPSGNIISGLSSIKNVALLSLEGSGLQGVPGIAFRFFKSIADGKINVIMITQASSEHSICIAINRADAAKCKALLDQEFEIEQGQKLIDPIKVKDDLCLLAIIGENMRKAPGVSGRLFNTLGKNGINVEAIAQGSSERNITFAIHKKDESKALNCIHDVFFLSDNKTIHLYIVGVGLIGSTLIDQILANKTSILSDNKINLVVNGVSNSRKMVLDADGVKMDTYKEALESSEKAADIEAFVDKMIEDNHAHSIFVDNTAGPAIAQYYEKILDNSIAISTPNKVAMSDKMSRYKALKVLAARRNTLLKFETNVGAGLPVISTLKGLTDSGDTIHKIEAVLSGSVSYIFNNYHSGMKFIDIVKEAQVKGLTEPDPRDDLSGADVSRKILILARESGFELESSDLSLKNILSDDCLKAETVDDFFAVLEKEESRFNALISKAESENKKLRFIASYIDGKGSIALQEVDESNPFYGLSGSDNMIVIHTTRYNETPLVVRGPGAGAAVTAAGLLSEIISMSKVL